MNFEILGIDEANADYEIYEKINEKGANYFLEVLEKLKLLKDKDSYDETSLDYFKSYLVLYLSDVNMWPNAYQYLIESKDFTNVIDLFANYIEKDNINKMLENLLSSIISASIDSRKKLILFHDILKNSYLRSVFRDIEYNDFSEHLFNQLRYNLDTEHAIKSQINDFPRFFIVFQDLFNIFFESNDDQQFILEYIIGLLETYKTKFKIEKINYLNDSLYSSVLHKNEIFASFMTITMLDYFVKNTKDDGINRIKLDYLFDDKCPIFTEHSKTERKYGYYTQLFFILEKYMQITFYKFEKELKYRDEEINEIEFILDEYEQNGIESNEDMLKSIMVKNALMLCQERVEFINRLKRYINYSTLDSYERKQISWLSNINDPRNHEFLDSILSNVVERHIDDKEYMTEELMKISSNVLKENGLTKNPHLKCQYIKIVSEHTRQLLKDSYYDGDIMITNNYKDVLECLPKLMVYIKQCSQDGDIYDMILPQYKIAYLFNNIVFPLKSRFETIFIEMKENQDLMKKLANTLIENFSYTFNEGLRYIIKVNQLYEDPALKEELEEAMSGVKYYLLCGYDFLLTIKYMVTDHKDVFVSSEIIDSFTQNLMYFLNEFVGQKRKKYKLRNPEEVNFHPLLVVERLKDIFYALADKDEFINCLSKEERSFEKDLITRTISILDIKSKITLNEKQMLINMWDKVVKIKEENADLYDDIPDELCDPIMSTLIEEPVMLPSTKIIMDKNVIARHLISDPHDPFNRDSLTLEELEKYNLEDEVVKEIDSFKTKIKDFKEKIKNENEN